MIREVPAQTRWRPWYPGEGRRLRLRGGGGWGPADQPHHPIDASHALVRRTADRPGEWTPAERHFRDGHTETWWATDARLAGYGPDFPCTARS
ncbi:hypothetical protein ACIBW9_19680 [Streptomyces sp. NPDC049541]|uniref:hypothetical protein n=1 Tax=Streptomyces sp. NPDC049541 TaxID=3365594 RepID=UPI00379310F3